MAGRMNRGAGGLLLAALAVVGCSGTGSGGCAGMVPIPTGRYTGPKSDNAVNIRLSPNGINYLNNNWQVLVDMFAPGRVLNVPVPCTTTNIAVIGDVAIADQGRAGCAAESCGQMDGVCNTNDVPANVAVTITGLSLVPQPPDRITATLQLEVETGNLYVDTVDRTHGACVWLSAAKCAVRFSTRSPSGSPPGVGITPNDNRLRATVRFSIDQKWDKLLAFEVTQIVGTEVCGASGAPNPPECLQPGDISLAGRNNCGDVYCGVADWDPLKNFVLGLISPLLQDQIKAQVATQSCEACGAGKPACPNFPATSATSVCQSNVCKDAADNSKCVPRFLGVEGRVSMGQFLGQFGAPANAEVDLSVAAGSSVTVDQGLTFGTRAGMQAVTVAPCVPPQAAPPIVAVTAPDFDREATPGSQYHAGLGVSSGFLNTAFHQAHQAGALCLQINTATVGLINTGLFKTFLPSLGKLATRDGKDAPMMVVLRPARAPVITVGLGTYDPVTKKPIKPLLLVTLPELTVDFYAMLDDRYARLFSLTADISLPLSLIFQGCDKVTPAIGDLRSLITNIRTANSEMLAEDPAVLADLIPAVIGLAEPAVASGLSPFALPALGNFKLKVNEVKGLGNVAGTEAYNHLGLYAQLLPLNATCAVSAPKVTAALKKSVMPRAEEMRLQGKPLPWPQAVLDVRALGKQGTPEFAWKVDEGLWTDFVAAPGDELVVAHPAFLMQGMHVIHVRARTAEDPHGISHPVSVGFRSDWEPPEATLTADRAADRLVLTARDVVTPAEKLEYAWRLGGGAFGDFGPAREISLSGVEAAGGLWVRVKDEQGNVGEALWRVPGVELRPEILPEDAPAPPLGCSATGGVSLFALATLLGLRRRR